MAQILVTIDTEIGELGKNRTDAFEVFIEGKIDRREVGYKLIMDILEKYSIKGEFFVDIYPYKKIGEDKFTTLCQNIVQRGHNIQLHTHPSMAFDEKRIYMYQYSLEEQIEILQLGKQKIKEWTSRNPIAHRAGGYGINENTFKALERVGIQYDSSYFYGNESCKIQCDVKNKPFKISNLIEIPVTGFKKTFNYNLFGINISQMECFQKLDVKYGGTVDNIKKVMNNRDKNSITVLFLHSFNFLHLPYNFRKKKYGKIGIDKEMIKQIEGLLSWISLQKKYDFNFTTFDRLKIDFSQEDCFVEISKKENILQKTYKGLKNKVLKTRET